MSKLNYALATVLAGLAVTVAVNVEQSSVYAWACPNDTTYINDSEQASMMGVGGNDSGHSGSVTQPSHSSSTAASSSVVGNTTKPGQSNTNGNSATQPSKVTPSHSSSTASSAVNGNATKPATVNPSAPKNNNSSSSHKSSVAKPLAPIHNVTKPLQTKPSQSVKNCWVDGV